MASKRKVTAKASTTSVQVDTPLSKHETLFYSLVRVDEIKTRIDNLIDKIQGGKIADSIDENVLTPCSLVELLELASGTLDEQLSGIHSRIDDLERLLF